VGNDPYLSYVSDINIGAAPISCRGCRSHRRWGAFVINRAELNRRRRQMNRRIAEVVAIRRATGELLVGAVAGQPAGAAAGPQRDDDPR